MVVVIFGKHITWIHRIGVPHSHRFFFKSDSEKKQYTDKKFNITKNPVLPLPQLNMRMKVVDCGALRM